MPIEIDLTGKNALVTGGTRGIGRVISHRLAEAGARVAMIYRGDTEAAGETLRILSQVSSADHFAVEADISVESQCRDAMKQTLGRLNGKLDVLVLNAAAGTAGPIESAPLSEWAKPFEVNVHGGFLVAQAAKPALQPGSSVVFISSGAGHDPIAGLGAYGVSKAAVNHMAAVLAQEWGPDGIRVNVVSPGHTAMLPVDYNQLSEKQQGIVKTTALRRLGTPNDVANAVLLFVSDLAGFVTGQTLRVNGGRT
jgi:3-oxoacyl-[acyl-carrier protein] reductase